MLRTPPWEDACLALCGRGFAWLGGPFVTEHAAFEVAEALIKLAASSSDHVEVVGDFVIPPLAGPPSRDFQTLHLDFGLPVVPRVARDIARYTALHMPVDVRVTAAATRLVSLRALVSRRSWPTRCELVHRFALYGSSHGAWEGSEDYVEGSLARLVEAAIGEELELPSVKQQPAFLCGTEFPTLAAEWAFFKQRGLDVRQLETEVVLQPGQLLVFDNLALAHGRRGRRQPGELHQRVFGHRALSPARQIELRDRVLALFGD